jgi:hypothetical protein
MLVVGVMHVPMLMLKRLMQVLVIVRFDKVQIDADPHEQCRSGEGKGKRLAEQRECQNRTDERGCREVSAGARSA